MNIDGVVSLARFEKVSIDSVNSCSILEVKAALGRSASTESMVMRGIS